MKAQSVQQHFQQGSDPYKTLGLGIKEIKRRAAQNITQDVLVSLFNESFTDDIVSSHTEKIGMIIGDDIEFCEETFDWKEEEEMIEYIKQNAEGRFTYDLGYGDEWVLVFSNLNFPNLEEIKV